MIEVIVERGDKRVFASAVDWPGYARSAKTEAEALEALLVYAPRYARVVARAGPKFVAPKDVSAFRVAHRVTGNATTDFGAPGVASRADDERLTPAQIKDFLSLLEASWSAFDTAARAATGKKLRTGPRGGGRSVEKMSAHVLEADVMYLAALGSRAPKVTGAQRTAAIRRTMLAAFTARARGEEPDDPSRSAKRWTPRFFARRSAWHALDHAWELEDRVI